tara:strand:- start:4274 stop:4660 length:387 start_codon:yes stop_codon:yes gene_type:complete
MASRGKWTIIFEDKHIIKNYDEGASVGVGFKILDDNAFWNDPKFSNIWAIQYGATVSTDEVEYRDTSPHTTYADANLGDISQFSNKWDALHLVQLQTDWDSDGVLNETADEKIARVGARPTSYTSTSV